MIRTGYGCSYFAGTLINAISTFKGSGFGIQLKAYAKITINVSKKKNIN